ncbi:MAG: hypothetical protein BGO21_32120 [Dyadobacter sp. 50-39]|uniref:tetratricopeptide repeat-containing sensor histidine kinase n=1 Tax=Dyadobacter sp. 50-39 TaxID=1895756 RepID=UPI0009687438|nr:tetratricopeptide repeat-containing sensor histidine kinase [Dyadobacter sp. 50-39]OJV15624.1 MAG: hypothetical protein BGO21_32120 [Dyadobacter sp. 50-39]
MADFSNALGIIRYQQEHYKEAIPYLHQAYREISSCTSPSFEYAFVQRQSVLNSIALCFEKSGQNDSAVAYYNKALAFIKSQKDIHPERQNFITTARGVVEGNLGGTYLRIGRFGLAEQHLKTNIMLNDRAGFAIEDAQTGKVKLAHLYLLQGRLPDAAVLLNQLQSDLESGRGKSSYNSEIWSRWYSLKSLYLEKKGDFRNAYFYFKRYDAHRDSLDAASKGFKDIDMDQLLREQVQQHKLGILEKEAEVKTVYVYALTIFLLMAISIATISWRNYRRSRQNIAKLTDLNAQLQQALTALENSQRENTRMLKVVAHDLRGPIGAISPIAEMMIQETGRSTDDLEMLSIIKQTGSNSLELVNNLMHLNSPTEQVSKKSQVDLSALIKQCADMLGPRARQKGQRIHLDLMPVKAVLNYEQFWRVISNLISNAIKFSPHASKISVFLHQDDSIKIVVKDQGIGIPSGIGNKIFDAFTDSRRKGTEGEESFGLGLSITKQIVEAHGGSISYISLPNAGTTFCIELPKTATDAG